MKYPGSSTGGGTRSFPRIWAVTRPGFAPGRSRSQYPSLGRSGFSRVSPLSVIVAAPRVARYAPEVYRANVLEPIELDVPKFDSVGLNYLLHCLPGSIRVKAVVFEYLRALANPGAVIFGATLLGGGVPRNWLARKVMDRNNTNGIFSNAGDDLEGLRWVLSEHLSRSEIEVVGCVAVFSGRL